MKLQDIKWPIYKIGVHEDVYEDMGVTYIEHSGKVSILDNKNLKGNTLGLRRLLINDIYNTKGSLLMLSDLLDYVRKVPSKYWVFIDNEGNLFRYKKTKYSPLIWREISNARIKTNIVLLNVIGIFQTFELPLNYWYKFKDKEKLYLGLIKFENFYVIYDISEEHMKDSRRKI